MVTTYGVDGSHRSVGLSTHGSSWTSVTRTTSVRYASTLALARRWLRCRWGTVVSHSPTSTSGADRTSDYPRGNQWHGPWACDELFDPRRQRTVRRARRPSGTTF